MPIVSNVVSQHAEEAAFLWLIRRNACTRPDIGLADLSKTDGRVEAHLDGLRIAGTDGWDLAKKGLEQGEDGELFAAAVLAFESRSPERIESVLAAAEATPSFVEAAISALGWLPEEQAIPLVRDFLENSQPTRQLIGIGAAAIHRWHPGAALGAAVACEDCATRARALKAVGELGDRKLAQDLMMSLNDPGPSCRFAAAWSGALLGLPACAEVLEGIAASGTANATKAAQLFLRRMDVPSALAWHAKLAADPGRSRLAVASAAVIGDPSLIPWLVSLMDQPPLARLAGESFAAITGADLAYRDLEARPPAEYEGGPNDDPSDPDVAMDPDDNLPWPDPVLVREWWTNNSINFRPGDRHLLGNRLDLDWLKTVLRDGRQRQRHAAALEMALRQPGRPLYNIKAPGFRQMTELGKAQPLR